MTDSLDQFHFNIDILGMGACNLKCPSCPVGNSTEIRNPKGMMVPETFRAILAKAVTECRVEGVSLFNWTEPLLHPNVPEFIRIGREFDVRVDLSSNLNSLKNIDAVLAENPGSFRISNSGFTQELYGVTHRGGEIDTVKANMIELVASKKRTGSTTNLHLLYHRYKANLDDEVKMRRYCESLGIIFVPVWAMMAPLEKVLAYAGTDPDAAVISDEDRDMIGRLLLPLSEALEIGRRHGAKPCVLQTNQLTLDFQGNVQLCCTLYNSERYRLGSFLETPLAAFQEAKYASDTCTKCMKTGAHVYYTYGAPEYRKLARKNAPWKHWLRLRREPAVGA